MNKIIQGDSLEILKTLESESIDCVITSPPYWALRDYGVEGQLGLEPTFQEYITKLCDIFDEVKRVLKKEGTCWVNLGDTYSSQSSYSENGRQGFEAKTDNMVKIMEKRFNHQADVDYGGKARRGSKLGRGRGASVPEKSLCQIPSRFAIEMSNRGWILRNEIIWHKPNCMPSSATDRFTVDFEKVFFFVKSKKYYFEQILEPNSEVSIQRAEYENRRENPSSIGSKSESYGMPARFVKLNPEGHNKRTVWTVNTKGYSEAHFATYPEKLIEPMILAGCPVGGVCMDIFMGAGTTAVVAKKNNRNYFGIELNPEYIKIAETRITGITNPLF